jgi:hypothetical protein
VKAVASPTLPTTIWAASIALSLLFSNIRTTKTLSDSTAATLPWTDLPSKESYQILQRFIISELILNRRNKILLRDNRRIIIRNCNNINYPFKAQWLLYVPHAITFNNSTFYPQCLCVKYYFHNVQRLFPFCRDGLGLLACSHSE